MPTLDFDSDQVLKLLTDALRAGPGSPQWREAVGTLRSQPGMDEYKLLADARELLESGKPYRSVRPGPGFTRKVMQGVQEEARAEALRKPPASTATLIAAAAAVVGLAVICVVGYLLYTGGKGERQPAVDDLTLQSFDRPVTTATFESGVPAGWNAVGKLPVKADHGLRLAPGDKPAAQGGGLVRADPLPAGQPFELDVAVRYVGGAGVVPEVFVTDDPDFADSPTGASSHEWVWTLLDDKPQVQLPDRTFPPAGGAIKPGAEASLPVKIRMNDKFAIVEAGGPGGSKWAGTHQLDPAKPRYVGVRFLVRAPRGADRVGVDSVKISKP